MNQEILTFCTERGILLDKQILGIFLELDDLSATKKILEFIEFKYKQKVITKSFFQNNPDKTQEILLNHPKEVQKVILELFEKIGISINETISLESEKGKSLGKSLSKSSGKNLVRNDDDTVKLTKIYQNQPRKIEVEDFVRNFRNRFNVIRNILQQRSELENLTSINRLEGNKNCSIIGMVYDKRTTKNENLLLEIEDLTGKIAVIVNKNRPEVYEKSKEVLLDDIIGLKCSGSKEILFVNDIIFPDIKILEKKKAKNEEIAAFIGDTHVGSNKFLENNFLKFISWLNGSIGNEKQRQEALKVKYLFITGDTIDGVGVYPGQENELKIKDVNEQYQKLTELLLKIRSDIKIIMCAGQHDAVRVAEPQPIIGEYYGASLYQLKNLFLVTNPSLIEIGSDKDVKFKVLMYHGASMHGIISSIDKLRLNRAQDHPTEVVKYMLRKRHLAPSHSLTTYTPMEKEDPLLILEIPDIVATADLHKPEVSDYNGILLIASSCWQSITPFEEKIGNNPDPCKVPIFNLKTREIKILDFSNVRSESESENDDNENETDEKEQIIVNNEEVK